MSGELLRILVPMGVFSGLVTLLAVVVLAARRHLEPQGKVQVTVNAQRTFNATAGDRLLWQLAEQHILLPAACGGRGACGQCRVNIRSGGGPVLPAETSHLGVAELRAGTRLACMVTVREPLEIRVPPEVMQARRWRATVAHTRHLSTFLKEVSFRLDEPIDFSAGDYMLLEAPPGHIPFSEFELDDEYAPEWRRLGFDRLAADITEPTVRAYSLANPPAERDTATFVVRIATPPLQAPDTPPGRVSSYVFALKTGNQVVLSGPFGEFHAKDSEREMIMIGGGAGVAPLRSMLLDLLETRRSARRISFWYGARNLRELVYRSQFEKLAQTHENFRYEVALSQPEQGTPWNGATGLVHKVVYDEYLASHPHPEEAEYYLCGPPLMTAAVLAMLDDLGVDRKSIIMDDFGG